MSCYREPRTADDGLRGWHRIKHGRHATPEYKAWAAMIQRCTNPNHPRYPLYGARGIKVCERWLESFANFFADLGPRPEGYELDKIDNDGNYEPSNCRWTTKLESRRDRRGWVIRKAIPIPVTELTETGVRRRIPVGKRLEATARQGSSQ